MDSFGEFFYKNSIKKVINIINFIRLFQSKQSQTISPKKSSFCFDILLTFLTGVSVAIVAANFVRWDRHMVILESFIFCCKMQKPRLSNLEQYEPSLSIHHFFESYPWQACLTARNSSRCTNAVAEVSRLLQWVWSTTYPTSMYPKLVHALAP